MNRRAGAVLAVAFGALFVLFFVFIFVAMLQVLRGDLVASGMDEFTVADFRDRFGISRKYAVPLLEWLDRAGITRRDGDVRVVRP